MKNLILYSLLMALFIIAVHAERPSSQQKLVSIRYVESKTDEEGYRSFRFRVTNVSDRTLSFWGHSNSSPLYEIRFYRFGIFPSEVYMGWCGDGTEEYSLLPKASFTFWVFQEDKTIWPWAAGVSFRDRSQRGGEFTIWSDSSKKRQAQQAAAANP
jgi:hypothetical protein